MFTLLSPMFFSHSFLMSLFEVFIASYVVFSNLCQVVFISSLLYVLENTIFPFMEENSYTSEGQVPRNSDK